MADLQPLRALVGDLLDPAGGETLEAVQQRVEGLSGGADREVARALLWLAALRIQLHRLRGAHGSLEHLRTRFRHRFPDLESVADYLEVRLLLEEQRFEEASRLLDDLRPEHRDPRARRRLAAIGHGLRGEILTATGREAVAHYEYRRARECLEVGDPERMDQAILAEIHNAEGDTLARLGELEAALGAYGRAGELASPIGFLLAQARSARGLGVVHGLLARTEHGVECLKEALGLYREAGSPRGILRTCVSLGRLLYDARELGQAMVYFQEAREQCAEGRHPAEESEVASLIGDILVAGSRYREAADSYALSLHLATAAGDPRARARALRDVGRIQGLLGRFAESESALVESRSAFQQLNDARGLGDALVQLVLSYAEQGKAREARAALDSLHRSGAPTPHGLPGLLEGLVLRRQGRPEEAAGLLEQVLRELSGEPGFYAVLACLELARVHWDAGDAGTSLPYCREAVRLARHLRFPDMERQALDLLARLDRKEWERLAWQGMGEDPGAGTPVRVFVSVLAVELRGVSALLEGDAAEAAGILDRYFDLATRSLVQWGGALSSGLGTRVLGVFGLGGPCDPGCAFGSARETLDLVYGSGTPLGAAAAVATGTALWARTGPAGRREATVLGGAADSATRLLDHAGDGELAVCPVTHGAAGREAAHLVAREILLADGQRCTAWTARVAASLAAPGR